MSAELLEKKWLIEDVTRQLENDSVRITTPNGFVMYLYKRELVPLLAALANDEADQLVLSDTTRMIKRSGELWYVDGDAWVNKEFQFGDCIAPISTLAHAIAQYVGAQWPPKD